MRVSLGIVAAACLAGVGLGHFLCGSFAFRKVCWRVFGCGDLVALVHGTGIYALDSASIEEKERLFAEAEIAFESRNENVSGSTIDRAYALLESQLLDKKTWSAAMYANRLCWWSLRSRIATNLRSGQWIEQQLAAHSDVTTKACRGYFQSHQTQFFLPERFRVAHLFLAAPDGTEETIVDVKRRTIGELLGRIDHGEKLSDLARAFSEDEASKANGGDLGYFSDWRMPDDFMAAVRKLHSGQTGRVVQTPLGFHILQLNDVKPARQMAFEEAEAEIRLELENIRRREHVRGLVADSLTKAGFTR